MTASSFASVDEYGNVSSRRTVVPTGMEHGMYAPMPPRLRLFARPNAESFFPSLGKKTFRRTSILWRDQRRGADPCSSCDMGRSIELFPSSACHRYSTLYAKTSTVPQTHVLLLITE